MSERPADYTVRSYSSGTVGRALNTIRQHHLVVDSPSIKEEVTSGEAFLLGVSACGVTLVEGAARDAGIPLAHTEVTIEGFRAEGRPAFDRVAMRFVLTGVSPEQAEFLVGRYRDG
ncbi:MAG TPA: hypothetical protein VFN57_18750 [Thermomicrobiaceae bacterium]|nr:hypothetical protein [Thermomicrobiaceae bacterium]